MDNLNKQNVVYKISNTNKQLSVAVTAWMLVVAVVVDILLNTSPTYRVYWMEE